ncbi:MAG: hypothetical protein LQ343_003523 [Gyalolechia ehrenbergii]|nr:MAG: hypothetical protein LQ343_003523 [Gyalolechia ehrenbergii]
MENHPNVIDLSDSGSDLSSVMEIDWPEEKTTQPKINQEPGEDYAELVRTGHNLRRREPTTYLAPWQLERQRRKSGRPKVSIKIEEESEDEMKKGERLANIPLARSTSPSTNGISMLLQAAVLLERSEVPCNAFGCPIKEPHSEGLFLHPEEVPDSGMANTFFAPSKPPPSVVRAFNNISGRPSLDDLHTKDSFFEYHTAPCRPSKNLSKVGKTPCKSKNCGVIGQAHNKGIFLQNGLDPSNNLARRMNYIFGISNPPPNVWESAIRCIDGVGNQHDWELVEDFRAHHVRLEDSATDKVEFYRWQQRRRAERP